MKKYRNILENLELRWGGGGYSKDFTELFEF